MSQSVGGDGSTGSTEGVDPLALPDLTEEGLLPLGAHRSTLDEVERVFVNGAPFEAERRRIMVALRLYAELVWLRFPEATLWIDGGFVTLKDYAAPEDADVVVMVADAGDYDPASHSEDLPLWTLLGVSADRPSIDRAERLQPFGGLIDGFFARAEIEPVADFWRGWWQRLPAPGKPDVADAKGYVEVTKG